MASWPDLKEVRTFLRLQPDATEDGVIDTARLGAIDYMIQRLGNDSTTGLPKYPSDTTSLPDAVHQAAVQASARLYRRRDSLDGTVGFGDLGVVRIGGRDFDVERLLDTYAPLVFG